MSSTASGSDVDSAIAPTTFTANSNIDITAQPAVITWRTSDGKDQCLADLNLDLHYDIQSSKAFFILRATVALKSHPRSRNTAVFIFIHPERIRGLVLDDSPCTTEAGILGHETVCLHFELSRLPVLVVPRESLAPRNQTSGNLLDSLRAVVQQSAFSIYAKIPCRRLSRQRLHALCDAASRGELSSIIAYSNASSLYAGAGGKIIEGYSLVNPDSAPNNERLEPAIESPAENPPSYDEVPPAVAGPHKRQRTSTAEPEARPTERLDRKYIEDICAQLIDNRFGQLKRDVAQQLQDLENRVIDYVDEQLILQRREAAEEFSVQTEDHYYGLKLELQSHVREEVEEAEGRILDHLSTASFSLQLNP
ncbi:hypothetical protein F4777DRAFT_594397 [Nemania sp. FL0916]|nr:hypothetical protein F4777DRAFT_594397 [Nemania sp. FL0916]